MKRKVVIVFLLICGFQLFDLRLISERIANTLSLIAILILSLNILGNLVANKSCSYKFNSLILLFYAGLFINVLYMLINGVSTYNALFVLLNYFGFLFYYFLKQNNYKSSELRKIIFWIAIIVAILMVIQQVFSNKIFFNQLLTHENFIGNRGTVRVRIPGMALIVFTYLYVLSIYIKQKEIKLIIPLIVLFLIPILQGFKSITFVIIIASLYLYKFESESQLFRINIKSLFSTVAIIFGLTLIYVQVSYINELVNSIVFSAFRTIELGEANVRIIAWNYYLISLKSEIWMYITGNGLSMPHNAPEGLFAVDLGIFGFYAQAGLIPSFALIVLMLRGIYLAHSIKSYYIAAFFIYMIMNGFLFNAEMFRVGIFYIYSIILVLLENKINNNKLVRNYKIVINAV